MSEENVATVKKRRKYIPSAAYDDYVKHFDLLPSREQKIEIKLLQGVARKKIFDQEKAKLKERLKNL